MQLTWGPDLCLAKEHVCAETFGTLFSSESVFGTSACLLPLHTFLFPLLCPLRHTVKFLKTAQVKCKVCSNKTRPTRPFKAAVLQSFPQQLREFLKKS